MICSSMDHYFGAVLLDLPGASESPGRFIKSLYLLASSLECLILWVWDGAWKSAFLQAPRWCWCFWSTNHTLCCMVSRNTHQNSFPVISIWYALLQSSKLLHSCCTPVSWHELFLLSAMLSPNLLPNVSGFFTSLEISIPTKPPLTARPHQSDWLPLVCPLGALSTFLCWAQSLA